MTRISTPRAVAATLAASLLIASAPAAAAPSRAELEASVIQLENTVAELQRRLSAVEGGGGATDPGGSRIESIQAELVRVVGELEEARFQNSRLQNELRQLRREIQLRDAEIAERLGLEPAFTAVEEYPVDSYVGAAPGLGASAFGSPFGAASEPPLGEPGSTLGGLPESDPSFFGDDPFAQQRAAAVAPLGQRAPLPDNPAGALMAAKQLVTDGRLDDAAAAFAEFQQRFGDSPEAGEALYWQGEINNARGQYEEAKNLYIDALRKDPSGPRAPDAMVALASSLQSLGLSAEACNMLSSFPRQYPNAALSVRAKADRVREAADCR